MVKIKNKKRKEALKKWVVSFLSLLVFLGNTPSTYASQYARESLINTNLQLQQKDAGALPVKQLDLGTGNVTLHESLLAVEGYHASISYNSEGVAQKAITWNRSQKQSTLGLGWQYPENRIVRLTKQTGTTEDDTYLLYNEGATYPLLFTEQNSQEKTYRIAKKHNWIVKYHITNKQWRLFMENGKIHVYGDGALIKHQAKSIEYNVAWGNWIGSSIISEKQKLLPISYNLSAIEDIYGEQVKFFYQNTEENVGEKGKTHTRASYLKKVEGLRGKTLHFTYQKKDGFEYSDPHTENGKSAVDNDKDAYQERYEDQFLKSITLKNRKEQQIKKINFEFKKLKKDTELQKRVLSAIHYLDAKDGIYMPAKTFDYFGLNDSDGVHAGLTAAVTKMYNSTNGALYGAIKQENLPEGVSYAFQYGKEKIQGANKTLVINFPTSPRNNTYNLNSRWSAPELFYGNDYVVAIFESQDLLQRQSHVKVYQWIGDRWKEQDLGAYDGYFYDRYFAKDQYTKSILTNLKREIFKDVSKLPGGAILGGVASALDDSIKDNVKTLYRVGTDIKHGKIGKAITDWFKGEGKLFKDIALDIAAGFEKEVREIKHFFDRLSNNKQALFKDEQQKLYKARQEDEANNPRKQYHITLQDDFFALTTSYGGSSINIFQKNKLVPGSWIGSSEKANITSKFLTFDSGDNFIALLDEITDLLYIYTWDGLIWNIDVTLLKKDFNPTILNTANKVKNDIESALDRAFSSTGENTENRLDHRSSIVAKNNMLLAIITDSHGINADITIFHHDENMRWKNTGTVINKTAIAGKAINLSSSNAPRLSSLMGRDGKIDVKLGNSFAVLQTYDNLDENLPSAGDIPIFGSLIEGLTPDAKKINSTYGIIWDENYENIQLTHLHSATGQSGVESIVVGDVINKIGKAHSLLVGSTGDNGKNYAFRYNGKEFSIKSFDSPYYTSGFGNDVVSTIVESSNKAYKTPEFFQYDPNTTAWSKIDNASKEQIAAPDFIDQAINVTVEVIQVIIQLITLPGLGEALGVAKETLQAVSEVTNVAQDAMMFVGPISNELVKDIMGTNHKSTSIANNYISVNGKLFHRNPSGNWSKVSNDTFQSEGSNATLVGSTNNVVSNFIPYTLKTDSGIENHIKLLGNGKVYATELRTGSNFTVHQDSITSTIGASAYVSYGPVSNNGFVQKNSYTKQFEPIASNAEERARRNRPAYKDATQVILHKVVGLDLDNELYDYPVTKVAIKQNSTELSAHNYIYDSKSAAYDANSHIASYGKVIDIPSSKKAAFNATIDLTSTDGGYIEHYYYNRHNTYGETNQQGYPSKSALLKLKDPKLVTFQSIHKDDTQNYKNGNITTLYGHPYATLIYNTKQEVINFDHTYYNVWEEDLRNTIDGTSLQENRIYLSRPVKKIHSLDNTDYTTKKTYDFAKHSLVLRKTSKEGLSADFIAETHNKYYTYAFEHYDALRKVNRLQEHFSTVTTVKQGNDSEKTTGSDVVAYETFNVNNKDILAPKNFYKLANNSIQKITSTLPEDIITQINSYVVAQAGVTKEYETIVAQEYIDIKNNYEEQERVAKFIHNQDIESNNSLKQLFEDIFSLEKNLNYYKTGKIIDESKTQAINIKIEQLQRQKQQAENQLTRNDTEINSNNSKIIKLNAEDNFNPFASILVAAVKFFSNNDSEIKKLEDKNNELRASSRQLFRNIDQYNNDISKENENLTSLSTHDQKVINKIKAIDLSLKNIKKQFNTTNTSLFENITESYNAFQNSLDGYKKENHDKVIGNLNNNSSDFSNSMGGLITKLNSQLTLPTNISVSNANYDVDFQNKIKIKINKITNLFNSNSLNSHTLINIHGRAISNGEKALLFFNNIFKYYSLNWIRNKTIAQRDKTTGIPISWYDAEEKYQSVILHHQNKKAIATFTGVNVHAKNYKLASYRNFEDVKNTFEHVSQTLQNQGHLDNHSVKIYSEWLGHILSGFDPNDERDGIHHSYIVSAWMKPTDKSNLKLTVNAHNSYKRIYEFKNTQEWKYFEYINPSFTKNPVHFGFGKRFSFIVDDVLIRPVGTNAKISVWDDNDNLVNEIANNGLKTTHIYDDAQQHIASIDNTGKMMDYTHHGYSKLHNNGIYTENAPNKNFKIHFQQKANYFKNSSNTTISANDLGNRFAASFTANENFTITKGNQRIQKSGTSLTSGSNTVDIGTKKNFLLLTRNNKLVVYADAKEIIQLPAINPSDNLHISGNIRNLITGKEPVVSANYTDGLARNLQNQYWYSTEDNQIGGKVIKATAYNGWGKPMIHTKSIYTPNTKLVFEPNFIDYNFETEEIQGNFVKLYNASKEINTENYQIPDAQKTNLLYYQTIYSKDPLQRVITTTKPGLNNKDKENTEEVEYKGIHGNSLLSNLGASSTAHRSFSVSSKINRNNTKISGKDVFGRAFVNAIGKRDKDELSISSKKYRYDANGNSSIETRLPLSYKNGISNTSYRNKHTNKDLLGDQFFTNTVDENTKYIIKNKKGLPVFSSTNNFDASKTDIQWNYILYDGIDRPRESGIVTIPGGFNENQMNLLANVPNFFRLMGKNIQKIWKYDNVKDNVHTEFTVGKIVSSIRYINDQNIENKYTYNQRGQITSKTMYIDGKNEGAINYSYFNDGKIKTVTYPNKTKALYRYDLNGRLYGVGTPTNSVFYAKYSYGTNGQIKKNVMCLGLVTETKKYTLQEHTATSKAVLRGQTLPFFEEKLKYTNSAGNYFNGLILGKEEQQEQQPINTFTYTYDSQYRLTEAAVNTGIRSYVYNYDVNGNLKDFTQNPTFPKLTYSLQNGTNKRVSTSDKVNDIGLYTSIGRTILGNTTQLQYDAFTRKVVNIEQAASTTEKPQVTYIYDSNNKRIQKTRNYTSTRHGNKVNDQLTYLFGDHNLPLFEKHENKTTNITSDKVYVYGAGYTPIAMLHKGEAYYFVNDYQNSLRNLVQAKGQKIVETYRYTPYGQIAYSNSETLLPINHLGTYLYTGQEFDVETGLYNYKARLYDPEKKIFLQPDPKHINYSPYTYANNNPISFVDKDGKAPTIPGYSVAEPLGVLNQAYIGDIQSTLTDPQSFKPFEAIENLEHYQIKATKGWFSGSTATYLDGTPLPKRALYTLNTKGEFFVVDAFNKPMNMPDIIHPRIAAGKVVAAGEVYFENGMLKSIDDESGHFKPYDRAHLGEERLRELGVLRHPDYKLGKASVAYPKSKPIGSTERSSFKDITDHRLGAEAKVNSLRSLTREGQAKEFGKMVESLRIP